MLARAQAQLRTTFGFPDFRGLQWPVIEHVLAGGDAVVLMPTGGGKSLCYQLPALLLDGVCVVVSPLIALMRDQVQALHQMGVRAAAINSALTPGEAAQAERAMAEGALDLVYVAPERLLTPRFLELLGRTPLALFAIDEAHCASQWGHDFRPEYLQLDVLAERWPAVPRLALTATADGPTREDIIRRLRFEGARVFSAGFDRPNLRYTVLPKDHPRRQLLAFITERHQGEAGIVYRLSRKKVEDCARWLEQNGVPALPYHAGLPPAVRQDNQDRFMREEGLVMVATVAFGMGIDKPNVRFVAHLDPPRSLEAYHQETGRAGRDGLPADAWMTFGLADVGAMRAMLDAGDAPPERKRVESTKLTAMLGYCETAGCRRTALLGHFGQPHPGGCANCDNCLTPVDTWDGTVAAQKALSAVYRTDQCFGAGYLADLLLGVSTERMTRFGHDRLKTFGCGPELDRRGWMSVFRQLAAGGLLEVDALGHGGLRLTPASWTVLRGERTVTLRRDPVRQRGKKGRAGRAGAPATLAGLDAEARELFEALRALRLELAQAQGVPPYAVFQDRTLLEMVAARPGDADGLAALYGVGERKLAAYGATFLAALDAHETAHGRPRAAAPAARPPAREDAEPWEPSPTQAETLRLWRELGDADAVARERGLTGGTVWAHLHALVGAGLVDPLAAAGLDAAQEREVRAALAASRAAALTPAHEALGGRYGFDQLRMVRAAMEREAREDAGPQA
ncbi:DNA helicase RecQ [Desulfocurvus vexinensis]|uniref:DNA helicase RecQ n=1 Tax=Desulfocurvus vexinensis TaxID=399548 RepID=UPI00048FA861|nr:DNA helicase RecQ [Desulfocurvus vexinensis]